MVTDPIADFITQLKNASAVGKASVAVPFSNVLFEVAKTLEREGFVERVSKRGKKTKKTIEVGLRYENDVARITNVKRASKPSRRLYQGVHDITPVRQGRGILILSTPKGILTGSEARAAGVGGEALCEIW